MWNALYTAEKVIIRWTLLTEACYFGVQSLGEWCRVGRLSGCGGRGQSTGCSCNIDQCPEFTAQPLPPIGVLSQPTH